MGESDVRRLPGKVAAEFAALPQVTAVVLAGSRRGPFPDRQSDFDLCVYAGAEPAEAWRAELAARFGERLSIGNHFWEPGDEWVARHTDIIIDIMYRSPAWIEEQLDRVLVRHQASVGYSTCFVHNVLHSQILFDREGWFAALQAGAGRPYPEALRRAVVSKNHPILRGTLSSYLHQIALALARGDLVSVNHRVAALLASYFDILFAVNRQTHPGEKRLIAHVSAQCPMRPPAFERQVHEVLRAAASGEEAGLLARLHELLDGLDRLLRAERLIDDADPEGKEASPP